MYVHYIMYQIFTLLHNLCQFLSCFLPWEFLSLPVSHKYQQVLVRLFPSPPSLACIMIISKQKVQQRSHEKLMTLINYEHIHMIVYFLFQTHSCRSNESIRIEQGLLRLIHTNFTGSSPKIKKSHEKLTTVTNHTQLSNLWLMPNSVCIGFDTAMKTGSSRRFKRYPTTYMWVSSRLPFTVD